MPAWCVLTDTEWSMPPWGETTLGWHGPHRASGEWCRLLFYGHGVVHARLVYDIGLRLPLATVFSSVFRRTYPPE